MDVPRLLPTLYQLDHHHHTFSISLSLLTFFSLSLSIFSLQILSSSLKNVPLFKFFLSLSSFSRSNHCYGIFFLLSILSFDIHPLYLVVQLNEKEWIGGGRKERREENREREKGKLVVGEEKGVNCSRSLLCTLTLTSNTRYLFHFFLLSLFLFDSFSLYFPPSKSVPNIE